MGNGGLRYQYSRLNIAEKLIVITVSVFIVNGLLPFLFRWDPIVIEQWFRLPSNLGDFLGKPWSLVTYAFFHGGFGHIFWNMLILYFFARIFFNLFDSKRFINVYFLGIIAGGLLFMAGYNVFPAFFKQNAVLIGASAGVRAIMIFICAYLPNQEVRLIFFNVKLWYIGVFVIVMDLIQMPIGNAGGQLAHLGGALLGYVYARQLVQGNDIGSGFSKFLDSMAGLFQKKEKKAPMKTVYRKENTKAAQPDYGKEANQRKIDAILDKISKSGYESLSKAEKDFLFKAGKED
ncbi:rhomboid family intramembrane serine protease [Aggregatimonas sangjinii]|uniref:Rhomboid family intramembrane serine protease n=1 Tax=Aggregatimonas sangjinii TaxID=2583587 RepID=A0A5B7SM95_9FLAO|nr:rhomboid family intramembrane serine protease [Aggregatimonas sangjinii]QCW99606.1 rhomboid family intramembrane serine protease [Aggregatimonas sangjinii]